MPLPVVQHLRSKVPGARPGDGTIRWLMDGEIFINQTDGVFCYLANTGALQTVYLLNVAALPTFDPGVFNALWNNQGALTISGYGL